MTSSASLLLGWVGVVLGALVVWVHPPHEALVDGMLAPLAAALLYVVVEKWTDSRGAKAAVVLYVTLITVTLAVLDNSPPSLASRNFGCGGSAQLLVGFGGIVLLEHLALSPWAWSALIVVASAFHPQVAFIPLLLMILLRKRSVLVVGFTDKARAAALRSSLLCFLILMGRRHLSVHHGMHDDSFILPLAFWIATWLLDGESLFPPAARVLIAGILLVATVADFTPWPATGLILLTAFVFCSRSRPQAPAAARPQE